MIKHKFTDYLGWIFDTLYVAIALEASFNPPRLGLIFTETGLTMFIQGRH